ncbi:hypothetical protein CBR_g79255, partial [Chara braunii]
SSPLSFHGEADRDEESREEKGEEEVLEGEDEEEEEEKDEEDEEEVNVEQEDEVLYAARNILDRPELLDVTFVCEDGLEVRANRALLASGNVYFSKLLYGDMKERSMDRIHLPTVRADSLQIVVRYLHGHRLRWKSQTSWDEIVEVYCLATQYQVDSLCRRIASRVPRSGHACEFGKLLSAAIPVRAEEILKAAVRAMNEALAFDSASFKGWSKESIKYVLENVQLHPDVTETMIAEAVLSAAPNQINIITFRQENCPAPSVEEGDSAAEHSKKKPIASLSPECSECEKDSDADIVVDGSLSRKDLQEIFEGYINLAFVEPLFVKKRIEPLQIVRPEVLSAVYKVQSICLSTCLSPKSLFKIPWRSLVPRVSFAPVKADEDGICSAYDDILVPSLWACDPSLTYVISEDLPQRVERIDADYMEIAMMRLPLRSGLHIWRIRFETSGSKSAAAGIVSSIATDSSGRPTEHNGWWLNADLTSAAPKQWAMSSTFYKLSGIRTFNESGDSVVVILDMTRRVLTFANKLERFLNHRENYPAAFSNLPNDLPLHPAVWLPFPGCADIEWIQSSPGPQQVRPR